MKTNEMKTNENEIKFTKIFFISFFFLTLTTSLKVKVMIGVFAGRHLIIQKGS